MTQIERDIAKLESGFSCPGTQVVRVQMDNSLCKKENLQTNSERESTFVWCVSWGQMGVPWHARTYGNTIQEAVQRAVQEWEKGH